MTLANFFLFCFAVGFLLSLLTFAFGTLHVHLPHHLFGHGAGHGVTHPTGHGMAHAPTGPHAAAQGVVAGSVATAGNLAGKPLSSAPESMDVSPVNFMTLTAFLAWFGGIGYLATRYYAETAAMAVALALGGGLAGASIVFFFLAKVLLPHETQMDPADYEMAGTLATVTSPIRPDGTGEIQFTRGGGRRLAYARSEDGRAIEKGAEVIVARYERGIAYVNLFDEMVK